MQGGQPAGRDHEVGEGGKLGVQLVDYLLQSFRVVLFESRECSFVLGGGGGEGRGYCCPQVEQPALDRGQHGL
eukprot:CAMPEP_0173184266 /NCGR_PEP_ID=MMETSP1141-20130122/8869_1 /TAXON_ID=483371 /ORGANISM="non described non described, Strain CCMP2298" /LENGTH=72 /DNA_ID=CAMNT_0014107595 /DNA_START=357 /DNA_END=575 /DNA_ORIENTATION=-